MDVITTHTNADFDALASMLAAKKLYPSAVLVFPGSQERSLRDFFVDSTRYVFETQRIKDIDTDKITRLILVDTRQLSRIGKFGGIIGRSGLDVHIYDHHPPSSEDIRGSFEAIREVGATVTIMLSILRERGIEVTADEATVMMLGLYEDTGGLTFTSTTPDDFYAAARKELPEAGTKVATPAGKGEVIGLNYIKRKISVKLKSGAINEFDAGDIKTGVTEKFKKWIK